MENDLTSFLPDDAETKIALDLMEKQFTTYGTAEVMVANISYSEAEKLNDTLTEIKGVQSVAFDRTTDRYNHASALYSVTFDYDEDNDSCLTALDEIKAALADYDLFISTELGNTLQDTIASEVSVIMVYVAVIVVAVLLFTSQTYGEVSVLLLTFVTAMILNQGSNFVFGKISFVSNSVTSILQLALSLDYAVILCNHFKEQHETMPIREAAISCADQIHPGDKRKLPDNGRRSCGNAVYAVQDRPGHGHMSYQGYTLRAFERVCTYAGTAGAVWAAYRENKT